MEHKDGAQGARRLAAAGVAKSFFPELVKGTIIVVCILLLLPTLIIAALPNIVFGYDSAKAEDVITLTGQARDIDSAYRSVQNYQQAEIDRILSQLVAAYTGEDGPQYDQLSVEQNTENTNIYWFIAITSAAHHQDLFSMSADSIRNMVVSKLTYTADSFAEILGQGEAATTMRTLKVDIRDLDPDALMRKLGFTQEEELWCRPGAE